MKPIPPVLRSILNERVVTTSPKYFVGGADPDVQRGQFNTEDELLAQVRANAGDTEQENKIIPYAPVEKFFPQSSTDLRMPPSGDFPTGGSPEGGGGDGDGGGRGGRKPTPPRTGRFIEPRSVEPRTLEDFIKNVGRQAKETLRFNLFPPEYNIAIAGGFPDDPFDGGGRSRPWSADRPHLQQQKDWSIDRPQMRNIPSEAPPPQTKPSSGARELASSFAKGAGRGALHYGAGMLPFEVASGFVGQYTKQLPKDPIFGLDPAQMAAGTYAAAAATPWMVDLPLTAAGQIARGIGVRAALGAGIGAAAAGTAAVPTSLLLALPVAAYTGYYMHNEMKRQYDEAMVANKKLREMGEKELPVPFQSYFEAKEKPYGEQEFEEIMKAGSPSKVRFKGPKY